MNTNSTPFIHSICYNKTKIRFSRGETEGERSGESDSRCLKLFPWETGSFPLGSNGRRRAQGTLYTRGLIETARHGLGRKTNESPNVTSPPSSPGATWAPAATPRGGSLGLLFIPESLVCFNLSLPSFLCWVPSGPFRFGGKKGVTTIPLHSLQFCLLNS